MGTGTSSIGGHAFAYNALSQINSVDGGTTATYQYDGMDERVNKTTGSTWTDYIYYGGQPMSELASDGTVSNYIYANGQKIVKMTIPSGGAVTLNYYLDDHLGTTQVELDASGAVTWQGQFTPFGSEVPGSTTTAMHYKFTGKERDAESGLDFFGARYYASTVGRWMSPDPGKINIKHLMNPQKWNKYNYVLNNPLSNIDSDGREEITITYRTFIAPASIRYGGNTYAGDNRGFSSAASASSRSSITVRIETDPSIRPGNPIISQSSSAGESKTLDANGNTIKSATATTGLPTAKGSRDANGNAVINIQQDEKNPLAAVGPVPVPQALTPGITANLNVSVTPDASTVQVNGSAASFPSSELNITTPKGTTPVIQFSPAVGATPSDLAKPDRTVNTCQGTGCH